MPLRRYSRASAKRNSRWVTMTKSCVVASSSGSVRGPSTPSTLMPRPRTPRTLSLRSAPEVLDSRTTTG
ncbi:Uncharacterised protein [Mycobacteroides abscessus subsp. abscessus]|nr:Uncharacterised protein [Mycobacteroides abscessus subsp. abscessus]